MKGVEGVYRFLNRVWRLVFNEDENILNTEINDVQPNSDQLRTLHKTIKKVTSDIENLQFNTAIAAMMVFVNECMAWNIRPKSVLRDFLILLNPFAPHISEELWNQLKFKGVIHQQQWPEYDEAYLQVDEITWVIQINGKIRDRIDASPDIDKLEIEKIALNLPRINELTTGKKIKKVIVVPKKLVNIVIG
jgi:leucyl-tRNA synthetase